MSNRRNFVKNSILASAGLAGLGSVTSAFAMPGRMTAPSDRIRVALIGGRNMGWSNLETFLKFPQVQCVSICDIDDEWLNKRASDVEKIVGEKPPQLVKDWRRVMTTGMLMPSLWQPLITGTACRQSPPWRPARMSIARNRLPTP